MYLIDTSIWIDYFRDRNNTGTAQLNIILEKNISFGITSLIYQEILQGASSQKEFDTLTAYFKTQRFFNPLDNITTYEEAAKIYFHCRKKGLTIRSMVDCLIAQIAIEHNLILLHNDKDYDHIHQEIKKLKLA